MLIAAVNAKRSTNYFCTECRKILRIRGGLYKRLHFYHLDPSPSCRLNGKSATHLAVQCHIQKLFSPLDLQLEKKFDAIDRIADCYLPSQNLIFEIQCSPISAEEVKRRNRDYAKLKLKVVWVLHDRRFHRFRLTAAEYFLRSWPHYYTNMNEKGQGIIYCKNKTRPIDLRFEDFTSALKPKSFWRHLLFLHWTRGKSR